jgi:hypothetical protein
MAPVDQNLSPVSAQPVMLDQSASASQRYFDSNDPDVLVVHAGTSQLNPTISAEFIQQQLERDPEAAAAEWLSQWRSDLADFVARHRRSGDQPQVYEHAPEYGRHYMAFVDPSGGSADSRTLAIAHHDQALKVAVLDCLREIRAPFSPEAVVDEFCLTLRQYRINKAQDDRYAGEWPREQYQPAEQSKSDLALPLSNAACRGVWKRDSS